jgi:hypothetical protein
MDLPENWEKKALILVGGIFIVTIIYALNPFQGTPDNTTIENSSQTINPIPFPKVNKANNTKNDSINGTINVTIEQAKTIAAQSNPGYNVGQPIPGTVLVNNTNYTVWIVPLTKPNTASKTIYIDIKTGLIVLVI